LGEKKKNLKTPKNSSKVPKKCIGTHFGRFWKKKFLPDFMILGHPKSRF
jgi:hypothetical protein